MLVQSTLDSFGSLEILSPFQGKDMVSMIEFIFFFHFHFSQNVRNTENDKTTPNESAGAQDSTQLIALGTPIQFDIVLPATEFLDQNRGGRYGQRQELFTLSDFRGEY